MVWVLLCTAMTERLMLILNRTARSLEEVFVKIVMRAEEEALAAHAAAEHAHSA